MRAYAFIGAALLVAAALGSPLTARAQSGAEATPEPPDAPAVDAAQQMSLSDWRALVSGRTLYYYVPDGLVGREYYEPNTDRVVFIYFNGQCFDGTWTYDDGVYCFNYDQQHCFRHFRSGDRLFVEAVDGGVQDVLRITNEVLSCEPDLISRAPSRDALAAMSVPGR